MDTKAITFVAQLYDIRTKRDGGGRLQLDFGADALGAITDLQKLNGTGDTNFVVAIVPFRGNSVPDDAFIPDENGEIPI